MQKEVRELNTDKKKRQSDFLVDLDTIDKNDLVFRVMTFEHIPMNRKKEQSKSIADHKVKLNFPPLNIMY